jgi:hypothetical protein
MIQTLPCMTKHLYCVTSDLKMMEKDTTYRKLNKNVMPTEKQLFLVLDRVGSIAVTICSKAGTSAT